jgi:hypothetical protein
MSDILLWIFFINFFLFLNMFKFKYIFIFIFYIKTYKMDYRYLVEAKNEFNNFLCGILTPHLYHGIKGMLKYSENVFNQIELKNKKGAKIANPGLIVIFKKTLDGISNLNNHEIEEEYLRIKNTSGCVDWFDNMVRAAFKSYVLFLTWDPKTSNSKYSDNSVYDSIVIKDFIHKCYIISCNYFRDNPELFINKNSKKEIFDILKMCIEMSIKKSLPYNQIIDEYLNVEFDKIDNVNSKEIENIKSMVFNMMNQKKYGIRPEINNLIIDESGEDNYINLEDPEYKKTQLENFINQEKIRQQNEYYNKEDKISQNMETGESGNTGLEEQIDVSTSISSIGSKKSYQSHQSHRSSKSNKSGSTRSIIESTTSTDTNGTETNVSTTLLSRASAKSREIENIINDSGMTNQTNQTNLTSQTIEETSSGIPTQSGETNQTNSKSSIVEILTSPPAIRIKKEDRLNDLMELGNKIANKQKKNIKVTRNKNNNVMSDKFETVEAYFQDMANSQ